MRLATGVFVIALVCCSWLAAEEAPAKTLLLLGQGPDGHPPATHEFVAGLRVLQKCLDRVPGLKVERISADEPWPEGPEKLKQADGAVLYLSEGAKWMQADPRRFEALTELASRGGGLVGLHWGIGCKDDKFVAGGLSLLGGCHGGHDRKYTVIETTLTPAADVPEVVRGLSPFKVRDEFYYQLKWVKSDPPPMPLLKAEIEGRAQTVAWTWSRTDGGRSCGFSGGHFHENWQREEYRRLAVQAILWSLKISPPADGPDVRVEASDLALPPEKKK